MVQPLKDSTTLALCKEISSQVCKDLEDEGKQQRLITGSSAFWSPWPILIAHTPAHDNIADT